jgi:hypothetical protein
MNFGCPTGSNIDLHNRLGEVFMPYPRPTIFDLPVSDGRQLHVTCVPFHEAQIAIIECLRPCGWTTALATAVS